MEQIILSANTQHVQDNQVIRPSQHGFMKGRSCLTNLISFYDKVTHLVDEEKAVDVVYLDFTKAFDTVSHSILLEKLAAHGLDGFTLHWGEWIDKNTAEKHSGLLVDKKLDTSQQFVLAAQKANCILGCLKSSMASRSREVILPLYSALLNETPPGVLHPALESTVQVYWFQLRQS
ncbi:hypothetical protein GRJ2_000423200 [Grus japonensis]|uniref:Reverse transcriptase domain-containing protein n=1 Tax=Grus japonensis TaxID=30415 RepID=A0ABC9W1U5_GRUJA